MAKWEKIKPGRNFPCIQYHHVAKGTRESHPSVHDLQSTMRLPESWMYQIMDTRMGFPCPFCNVAIEYFSPTPIIFHRKPDFNVI